LGIKRQSDGTRFKARGKTPSFRLKGFTLIEMVLVMVLAVLILGTVGPRVSSGIGSVKFRSAAQSLASALRYTRAVAVANEREAALTVFLDERAYVIDNAKRYVLDIPQDADVSLYTTTEQVYAGGEQGAFIFYPDGSASGGRITLQYHGQKRLIDINWLTGLVEIIEEHV
jgi:general secretion pathway protein H